MLIKVLRFKALEPELNNFSVGQSVNLNLVTVNILFLK